MTPLVRTTASEEIYHTLREEILSLRFAPGQELNLQLLCEQLEVSRSPVRDALMRLASDTLVKIFPQRGTHVSLINLKAVEEERFLRKSLEESAVQLLISKNFSLQWHQMQESIEAQRKAMEEDDFPAFLAFDDAFHKAIFEAVDLGRIWRLIIAQGGNYHRIRLLSFYEKNVTSEIIDQHTQMIDALRAKDLNRMLILQNRHLSKLLEETESIVARYPHYFTTHKSPSLKGVAKRSQYQ